jgi:hypothetical protein
MPLHALSPVSLRQDALAGVPLPSLAWAGFEANTADRPERKKARNRSRGSKLSGRVAICLAGRLNGCPTRTRQLCRQGSSLR